MKPLAAVIAPPSGIVEALKDFEQWCLSAREKLGAIDGYDYRSGEEYGLRRAELEAHRRICALLSQPKTGGAHTAPSVMEALRNLLELADDDNPNYPGKHGVDKVLRDAYAALSGKGPAPSVGDELVKALEKTDGVRHRNDAMAAWIDIHFCNLADQEAFANAIRSALSRTPASGEGR
jgi:hypothetical protein